MLLLVHVLHVLAAGIWLGGLVFTTTVVSPAFKRIEWSPSQRIAVRSEIGKQYSIVARFNLLILVGMALIDYAQRGWNDLGCIELTLIIIVLILSELHARVFAPRLGKASRAGDEVARSKALRISITVSMLNLLLSFAIASLAIVSLVR